MYVTAFNVDESDRMSGADRSGSGEGRGSDAQSQALLETAKKIIVQRMSSQPPSATALAKH